VGLLSLISSPQKVEIELGSRVLDVATGNKRDVDVTVVVKDGGDIKVFKGIEVKKHGRKLDATHVEQLACKLNDMPKMTERAIVSTTGYTAPAIQKARAHGITLFEIRDWDFSKEYFVHFKSNFCQSTQTSLEWIEPPSIKLNPYETIGEADQIFVKSNPKIYFKGGESKPEMPDLNSLLHNFRLQVQTNLFETLKDNLKADESIKNRAVVVTIPEVIYIMAPSGNIVLKEAIFMGRVQWVETPMPTHYKILKKIDEEKPYAGCMVAENAVMGLLGLMVSQINRELRLIHVSISDRNKNKILRQKIS
jgi:hypothetical protein